MRWLGRKTWVVQLVEELLKGRGVRQGSSFLDAFAGTATVARAMKTSGYRVATNDLMAVSVVAARGLLGLRGFPAFRGLVGRDGVRSFFNTDVGLAAANSVAPPETCVDDAGFAATIPLRAVLGYLNASEDMRSKGFVWRQYSSAGPAKRRFFRPENAERIDGMLSVIGDWSHRGWIDLAERDFLLTSLVDAADRVANVSGIYGAFLKKWQPNALKDLTLEAPPVVPGLPAKVFQEDANELVSRRKFDVVYVDPPYNERQYAKNFHVLEVIAEWLDVDDKAAYEASVRGKTGLLDLPGRESSYCGKNAAEQLVGLIESARTDHIVVSYSEEGVVSCEAIMEALSSAFPGFNPKCDFVALGRKRFRSATDDSHSYRVLEGRKRDEVAEWLFYAAKGGARRNPGGPTLREIALRLESNGGGPCS